MSSTSIPLNPSRVAYADQNLTCLGAQPYQGAAIVGGLGLTLAVILGVCAGDGMREFWYSYLLAACFYASLSLGGLIFISLQHITRSGWSVVVRRIAEIFAASITVVSVLFVPILVSVLLGVSSLYIWNDPVQARTDELIRSKVPYLNSWFFVLRSVAYFAIWIYLSRKFLRLSLEQDANANVEISTRLEKLSAPTLIVFALTVTFASIDWMMSLDPHWFSSIFGIYFFSGCMVGFLAALNIVVNLLKQRLKLVPMINSEHRHDMGKLLFGFMCFWAYIAFSQYLLIWYANVPEETIWFKARQSGGWAALSIALIAGHFALPFFGLMSRSMKRNPRVLAVWSLVLLVMHYVDLYWLIIPGLLPAGPNLPLLPISCLMGVGGIYVAGWLAIAGRHSLIPLNDPRLPESLASHVV